MLEQKNHVFKNAIYLKKKKKKKKRHIHGLGPRDLQDHQQGSLLPALWNSPIKPRVCSQNKYLLNS